MGRRGPGPCACPRRASRLVTLARDSVCPQPQFPPLSARLDRSSDPLGLRTTSARFGCGAQGGLRPHSPAWSERGKLSRRRHRRWRGSGGSGPDSGGRQPRPRAQKCPRVTAPRVPSTSRLTASAPPPSAERGKEWTPCVRAPPGAGRRAGPGPWQRNPPGVLPGGPQ